MHADVNGTRLWFDVEGPALVPEGPLMRERPTVVLLHGGPGSYDHSYLKPDFARLAAVAQVVYLDLRGHGRSLWGDPACWSFEDCADDVRAFCDAVGIVRPVVLGHSLGGMVAMIYAARHPNHPGALVLQSTCGRFDLARLTEAFRSVAGDAIAAIVERTYRGDASVTPAEWKRAFRWFGPWVPGDEEQARKIIHLELNRLGLNLLCRFNALEQLAAIQCVTLVCVGDLDPVTPVSSGRELVAALPAGKARLEVIEGGGHFPWRDVPARYWPVVTGFVAAAG